MTAVEWLVNEINKKLDYVKIGEFEESKIILQQALELEKEQKAQSYKQGHIDATIKAVNSINNLDADEFLEKKDIWNHPYIENRLGESFELRDLLNEFKDSI